MKIYINLLLFCILVSCESGRVDYSEAEKKRNFANDLAKVKSIQADCVKLSQKRAQSDFMENNLNERIMLQFNEYSRACYEFDIDKIIDFIYPDVFTNSVNNGEYESILDAKYATRSEILEFKQKISKTKTKFTVIEEKPYGIYYFNEYVFAKIKCENIFMREAGRLNVKGNVLCISDDRGESWKFVENDPEIVYDILKIKFDDDVIKNVLE